MIKKVKKIFVPHKHNEYKPHLLRNFGAFVLIAIAVISFGSTSIQKIAIERFDFLANVIPAVLVNLTNEARLQNGAGTELAYSSELEKAAEMKARDMADKGYFAHTSPEGKSPWYWINEAGYRYESAGENLAVNFSDSIEVTEAWMDSPTHRANILSGGFTEIGIATAKGQYEGRETTFVVQMFGRPISKLPVVSAPTDEVPVAGVATQPSIVQSVVQSDVTETVLGDQVILGAVVEPVTEKAIEIASSPSLTAQIIYMILTTLVGFSLLLVLSREASRKHIGHFIVGLGLLLGFGIAIYVFKDFILGGVTII